jgi:hypothetical protein
MSTNPNTPGEHGQETPSQQDATQPEHGEVDRASSSASSIPPPPPDEGTQESDHSENNPEPWWLRPIQVLGIIAGIVYTVITWGMWNDSHRNFVIDQRPWVVGQASSVIHEVRKPGVQPTVIMNIGKTPARDVSITMRMEIVNVEDTPSFSYSEADSQGGRYSILYPQEGHPHVLGVFERVTGTNAMDMLIWTQDLENRFNGHEIAIVIYYKVEYRDVFRTAHSGTWCQASIQLGMHPSRQPIAVQKCAQYNNADYD